MIHVCCHILFPLQEINTRSTVKYGKCWQFLVFIVITLPPYNFLTACVLGMVKSYVVYHIFYKLLPYGCCVFEILLYLFSWYIMYRYQPCIPHFISTSIVPYIMSVYSWFFVFCMILNTYIVLLEITFWFHL